MFARFDKMSKTFTKYGKEIAIAIKEGGPDPESNAKLRVVISNAKSQNMPKDRIEAAIKRSSGKDTSNYEELSYEAMCMKGVGLIIETATDNPTRTVANIRMHLNPGGRELGKSGSLDFAFERKSIFVIKTEGINTEELEFELAAPEAIQKWLKDNQPISNDILKWETELWGEIPADFGRK